MFINYTPFPGISFDSIDVKRRLNTTTLVRGKFRLQATRQTNQWELRPDTEQGELFSKDIYYDDDLRQPVRYESDFTPFKANTDVILNGNAYAQDKTPRTLWHYGIAINQDDQLLLDKILPVVGPRSRHPQVTAEDASVSESHHPGRRLTHFGYVLRSNKSRIRKAGTYDKRWLEQDHPFLPQDFKESHYQGAPEDQQIKGYLKGNESITLSHLLPGDNQQHMTLPAYRLLYQYRLQQEEDNIIGKMQLDTLLIDIESQDPDDWRVYLSWRSRTPAITDSLQTEAMMTVPESHRANTRTEETTEESEHGR